MSDDYERVKTWCNDPRKMPCAPYNSICRVFEDYDRLRAELAEAVESRNDNATALAIKTIELAEARRLLDEARKQEPVGEVCHGGNRGELLTWIDWKESPSDMDSGTKLYAAPVPAQPAVPDDVARDAARLALVWRVATGRETDEERATLGNVSPNAEYDEFVAGIDAAIISATEGRSNG